MSTPVETITVEPHAGGAFETVMVDDADGSRYPVRAVYVEMPFWPDMEAMGPTLAYDHTALLGEEDSVPRDRAARVDVPTLVIYGDASFPFMAETAKALAQLISDAELRNLADQTHDVNPEVLSPVLEEFLRR